MRMLPLFCCLMLTSTTLYADPPSRVARLSDLNGTVSFSPAGTEDWVYATRNRPLVTGDKLWNDDNSQSLLQLGGITIGIGANSSVGITNLDDSIAQFQLTQGTLLLHVERLNENQTVEIDTPNLAFSVNQPGDFRINVNHEGTVIIVRTGEGEAYSENNSYLISAGQAFRFTGTDISSHQPVAWPVLDDLDQWFSKHFAQPANVTVQQYVSPDVIGSEDLNQYGKWETDRQYGNIWYPSQVSEDWAPYREGDFVWIEPWGWSWVGEEPWGFAPYHYGRWAYTNRWGWIPGPHDEHAIYAPALIGFLAGVVFGESSDVAWFPLGPGEVYYPSYQVSQNYFMNVNAANTFIHKNALNKAYSHRHQRNNYRNIKAPNAITGVPRDAFGNAQLGKKYIKIPHDEIKNATFTNKINIAPERNSLTGPAPQAKKKPAANILNRQIITKSKVPPSAPPFNAKQEQQQQTPAQPLKRSESTPQIKQILPHAPHTGQAPHPPTENVPVQVKPKTGKLTTEQASPSVEQIQTPKQRGRTSSQERRQHRDLQPITTQQEQTAPVQEVPERKRQIHRQERVPSQQQAPRELPKQAPKELHKQEVPRELPKQQVPRELPKPQAPRELPKPQAPRELPKAQAPRELPKPQAPRELPKAQAPRELPKPQAPKELPKLQDVK